MVPAPLTGRMVREDVAARHPIAVMIDDQRGRAAAVGLHRRLRRLAGTRRGRHPALHADLPGPACRRRSGRCAAPGSTTSRGPPSGEPCTPTSAGPRRRCRRSARRVAASWSTTPTSSAGAAIYFHRTTDRFAPHNVYTSGKELRSLATRVGATDEPLKAAWTFAPDAPLSRRPNGGSIVTAYRYNTITYRYDRKTNTYLRSVTGAGQADRSRGRQAASRQRTCRDGHVVRAAQRRQPEASTRGTVHRQGHGLDRDERQDDQGHVAQGARSPCRRASTTRTASRSR